ncbi:pyrroline-5-carboxylate reductase [Pseudorhodobacter sp. W20_MBD10_FR17]|uniref:pyrroline-5-carboxylate reductase n=1 Tax=Pseudorhodobacter sp. W20_MBD10_FR17 TaxID=3240266 RepID=UPI003F94E4E6
MNNPIVLERLNHGGLVLFGCGKMGSALLQGWIDAGVSPRSIMVMDPRPSDWLLELQARGLQINGDFKAAAVCVLAVKPQMITAANALTARSVGSTLFISIAAGTTLMSLATILGSGAPIVRAMPNTPAAIGQGVTAISGNQNCTADDLDLAQAMLEAVGQVVRLESEDQMDAVTGVSGSGPAYVFYMIECLAAAGRAEGLPAPIAMQLAKATISGAGALAQEAAESVSQLRENVTSPSGTTAAGLKVLMAQGSGLLPLMCATVHAATLRSVELGSGQSSGT